MQTAIVIGAAGGIGRAIVAALVLEYRVVAVVHNQQQLSLFTTDNIIALHADITDEQSVNALLADLENQNINANILIHAAGILNLGYVANLTPNLLQEEFSVNVIGIHRITQALLPKIMKTKGILIYLGSDSGLCVQEPVGYSMTKHALAAYTDGLRMELQKSGVRVVLLTIGNVQTQIVKKAKQQQKSPMLVKEWLSSASVATGASPETVAEQIIETIRGTQNNYVVLNRDETEDVVRSLIEKAVAINAMSKYALTTEQLHAALDFATNL